MAWGVATLLAYAVIGAWHAPTVTILVYSLLVGGLGDDCHHEVGGVGDAHVHARGAYFRTPPPSGRHRHTFKGNPGGPSQRLPEHGSPECETGAGLFREDALGTELIGGSQGRHHLIREARRGPGMAHAHQRLARVHPMGVGMAAA